MGPGPSRSRPAPCCSLGWQELRSVFKGLENTPSPKELVTKAPAVSAPCSINYDIVVFSFQSFF